jgi:hypothetical protein
MRFELNVRFSNRVEQLVQDGFLVPDGNNVLIITEKGLAVLFACADRPVVPKASKLNKRALPKRIKPFERGDHEDA